MLGGWNEGGEYNDVQAKRTSWLKFVKQLKTIVCETTNDTELNGPFR